MVNNVLAPPFCEEPGWHPFLKVSVSAPEILFELLVTIKSKHLIHFFFFALEKGRSINDTLHDSVDSYDILNRKDSNIFKKKRWTNKTTLYLIPEKKTFVIQLESVNAIVRRILVNIRRLDMVKMSETTNQMKQFLTSKTIYIKHPLTFDCSKCVHSTFDELPNSLSGETLSNPREIWE